MENTIVASQLFSAGIAQTPEVQAKIVAKLNEKFSSLKCAACGSTDWTLGPNPVMLAIEPDPKRFNPEGPRFPCIVLSCVNCGLIQLHNALTLGLGEVLGV